MKLVMQSIAVISCLAAPSFAGDVKAAVKNGTLFVTGGASADEVTISTAGLMAHEVDVTPTTLGTTVNGAASLFHATGVKRDVRIDLRGGDDVVTLAAELPRDLDVELGGGEDRVLGAVAARDCRVEFGAGKAHVFLNGSTISRDLSLAVGRSWDEVKLQNSMIGRDVHLHFGPGQAGLRQTTLDSVAVGRRLAITGGPDRGAIDVVGSEIHGATSVRLGAGVGGFECLNSQLDGALRASASGTAAFLLTTTTVFDDVRVSVRGPSSSLSLVGSAAARDLRFTAKGGVGTLLVDATNVGRDLHARAAGLGAIDATCSNSTMFRRTDLRGAGTPDRLLTVNSLFTSTTRIDFAGGDDVVALGTTQFGDAVKVLLGAGDDRLFIDVSSFAPLQNCEFTSISVACGPGDDRVDGAASVTSLDAAFALGSGNNIANLTGMTFGGALSVSAGSGDDAVDLTGSLISGTKTVSLGGGTNSVLP